MFVAFFFAQGSLNKENAIHIYNVKMNSLITQIVAKNHHHKSERRVKHKFVVDPVNISDIAGEEKACGFLTTLW